MTDIFDRLAEAIFEASGVDLRRGPLSAAPAPTQRMVRAQARAALEALRDPSPAMVAAGEAYLVRECKVSEAALWRAMVDAAAGRTVPGHA